MDIWKSEMESCCSMNIEALYKRLLENKEKAGEAGFLLSSGIAAAPHDEMLFDSVTFYVKTVEDGKLELTAKVHYWHTTDGPWDKVAVIGTFPDVENCLEWLKNEEWDPSNKSADILTEKCES